METIPRDLIKGRVQPFRVFPANWDGNKGPTGDSVHIYELGGKTQHLVLPGDWQQAGPPISNLYMYDGPSILGELLRGAPDGRPYRLSAMYIEYDCSGASPISPPTNTDRAAGRSYYESLLTSATRNYLRVPMTAVILDSTDAILYPNGNRITCFAQTDVSAPVYSDPNRAFSSTHQAVVIGGALVSTPNFADATQDRIFSRFYLPAGQQLAKLDASQVGLKWPIVLA